MTLETHKILNLPEDIHNDDLPIELRAKAAVYYVSESIKKWDKEDEIEWRDNPINVKKRAELAQLHKELLITKKQLEEQISDIEREYASIS